MTSVTSYDLVTPGRIQFGWGRFAEIGRLAAELGRRAFVVHGSRHLAGGEVGRQLCELLEASAVERVELTTVTREPEVDDVDAAVRRIREHRLRAGDFVLALGGGSAIDMGKAVAALATNTEGETVRNYLEGVGRGLQITVAPLPVLAVPTTAGTGSEATKNAVISSISPPFKKSLRSSLMMPRVALVDPELTVSLPPKVTAHTGMDAITQLVESYLCRNTKSLTQSLAVEGLRLALPAIEEAFADGTSRLAREAMAQAALLSGMALANSGLGMAHGVAAALGVHCQVPHGLACAVMLPVALEVNRSVCEVQIATLARLIGLAPPTSTAVGAADALVHRIDEIGRHLGVPRRLSDLQVEARQVAALVRDSRGNSMNGNPRELSDAQLGAILEAHL
jgi:alcohol dehydrogenase class IV